MTDLPPKGRAVLAGDLAALFASLPADEPVGIKFDPWAPVGRVVEKVRPEPKGNGLIVHMTMGGPEWD